MEFYPGIKNLILPRLSYQGCHVRTLYVGCIGTHAHGRQVMAFSYVKRRHHMKLHPGVFMDFWKLILE